MESRHTDWFGNDRLDEDVIGVSHLLSCPPTDLSDADNLWVALLTEVAWLYGASATVAYEIARDILDDMEELPVSPLRAIQTLVEARQRALRPPDTNGHEQL